MPANLENSEVATGLEKVSFHFNPKERQCQRKVKPLHNVTQFHMLGRLCSESFKLGFNSMWTETFQMHKWGFEEAKELEFKLTTFFLSWRKQGSFRETPTNSASLITLRSLTEWITTNWKILKKMGVPDHLTCLLRNLYVGQEAKVRTGHRTTDWFKIRKEYFKAVYCHHAYLTHMQGISCKMLGWKKHKLESRLPGEISIIPDMQMTPPSWQKAKKN